MRYAWMTVFLLIAVSVAQQKPATLAALEGVGIDQRLNATVPRNASFFDEDGRQVTLGNFLGKRPVLLVPVYFTCPMLCSQTLHGVVAALRPLSLHPGRDFDVVVFSFNPGETISTARTARDRYTRLYSSRDGTAGWHFLVGPESSIHALTEAIGFHYRYDAAHKMFIHQSGVMILTPDGRIARYFYGVEYEPKDFNLGLVEASNGRIGSPADKILLFCYHYDLTAGKYTASVLNLLRLAGIATLLVMAGVLGVLWKRDLFSPREEGSRT